MSRWQPVELTFDGPDRSENAATFRDFRFDLSVTTPSGEELTVPGFFAADGDAANTSATSGNKWRVRFLPLERGTYSYEARFRCGQGVAGQLEPGAGQSCGFDGQRGTFDVSAARQNAEGNYARGLLSQDGRLMRFSNGDLFIKGGTDSPETFFAYSDFDGTSGDGVREYAPHRRDWQSGDPTWDGDRGKEMIGALNYLVASGVNAFSFMPMNVNGDGDNVWPWTAPDAHSTYDVSKLAQWEVVFSHADRLGMFIHFKTQERENDHLLGGLSTRRKLYYRELVARFGHHHALNWNLGEENTNSDGERRAFAQHFEALDPYNHPVVVHTFPNQYEDVYGGLVGVEAFDGPSFQLNGMNGGAAWNLARRWLQRSEGAGDAWVCSVDEPGGPGNGVYEDGGGNLSEARGVLYASYLAGCYGTEWYFGYNHPNSDLDLTDFRSRDTWWSQVDVALEAVRDFYRQIDPADLQSREVDGGYVLEGADRAIAYLQDGGSGYGSDYGNVTYVNPRTGERSEGDPSGGIDAPFSGDAVALLSGSGNVESGGGNDGGGGDAGNAGGEAFQEENGLAVIEMESGEAPAAWEQQNALNGHTGAGYLHYDGRDHFNNPGQDAVRYQVAIQNPGTYRFQWRSQAGGRSTTDENDSWLKIDADAFYGEKGGRVVCPKGYDAGQNDCSGSAPEGAGSRGWFKVYVSRTNWDWRTATNDNDPYGIFAQFDEAGTYTIQVAARSVGHTIDRMVLHRVGSGGPVPNNPLSTSIPESTRGEGGGDNGGGDNGGGDNGGGDNGGGDNGGGDNGGGDNGGGSNTSTFASVSNLQVAEVGSDYVRYTWTTPAGAERVAIRDHGSAITEENARIERRVPADQNSYIDDGRPGGETRYLRLKVIYPGGNESAWSQQVSATPTGGDASPEEAVVFAVNAGGGAFTGADGTSYQADPASQGGTYSTDEDIAGTQDGALYQTERYGDFSYATALEDGSYEVAFRFAEIYWEDSEERVFDVSAEGQEVIGDLDLHRQAGFNAAYDVTRTVQVNDGELNLDFSADRNNAKLSALRVTRRNDGGGSSVGSCSATEDVATTAQGLPLRFFGTPVGGRQSASLDLDLAGAQRAVLSVTTDDVDRAAEATMFVNGTAVELPDGAVEEAGRDAGPLTGTAPVDLSLLEDGENEITFAFASNLGGQTTGYAVENVQVTLTRCTGGAAASSATASAGQEAARNVAQTSALGSRPQEFSLGANYPNPVAEQTTIRFALPQAGSVRLVVYDMLGREVAVLADGQRSAGHHTVTWEPAGAASGVYLYRLQAGDFVDTRRMTLVR